jgi:PAS domain S-box-containing protein
VPLVTPHDRKSGSVLSVSSIAAAAPIDWFEMCPAGSMLVASTGTIELANQALASMFGYEPSDLLGRCSDELVPPALRRRHAAQRRLYFLRPLRVGVGAGVELQGMRRDGSEFTLELALAPLRAASGQPPRVLAMLADISARKKTDAEHARRRNELERSNAELEQFAYVASHDLREPLRMIASYTELLAEHFEGKLDPRTERFIGYVREGAKRMQRLIDDLLAFSRLEARAQAQGPARADDALHHALADMRPLIRDAEAQITHDVLPTLLADSVQLEQLFQNILHNAIKFRRDEPVRVHVSAEAVNDMWRFAVQDNGIGIEQQYCARIFKMFQRLHDRSKYDGSGIGLAMAKKIVERHGGEIWVESNPGQGSTFYFTLPNYRESHAA